MRIFIITAMLVVCSGCGRQGNKGGGRMPKINLTDSCVAYYKLDDNAESEVVLDSVGGHHATLRDIVNPNTSAHAVAGKVGGALSFSVGGMSETRIECDDVVGFKSVFQSSFTVCGWVRLSDDHFNSPQYIFGMEDDNTNRNVWMRISNGAFAGVYTIDNFDLYFAVPNVLANDAKWHHFTFQVEQVGEHAVLRCFVDGQQIASMQSACDMSQWNFWPDGPSVGLMFGNTVRKASGGGECNPEVDGWLYGALDGLMVFDKALSAEEVAFLYNGGRGTETLAGELYRTPHSLGSPWGNSLAAPGGNSLASPDGNDL